MLASYIFQPPFNRELTWPINNTLTVDASSFQQDRDGVFVFTNTGPPKYLDTKVIKKCLNVIKLDTK